MTMREKLELIAMMKRTNRKRDEQYEQQRKAENDRPA